MNAPCKGCGARESGCHGRCDAYAEYKRGTQEINQRRREHCDTMAYIKAKRQTIDRKERRRRPDKINGE